MVLAPASAVVAQGLSWTLVRGRHRCRSVGTAPDASKPAIPSPAVVGRAVHEMSGP